MTAEFTLAVHALVYLDHTGTKVSSEELAKNVCTNPARLRMVMSKLKKAGIIDAKEGAVGGFSFTGPQLDLYSVLDALGQKVVQTGWRSGDMDADCMISSGMGSVMDGVYGELNDSCRELLSHITIADVGRRLLAVKNDG